MTIRSKLALLGLFALAMAVGLLTLLHWRSSAVFSLLCYLAGLVVYVFGGHFHCMGH